MSYPPPSQPPNDNNGPKKIFLRGGKIMPIARNDLGKTIINVSNLGTFPRILGARPQNPATSLLNTRHIAPCIPVRQAMRLPNFVKPGIVKIEMTPQGRRIVHSMERQPITNVGKKIKTETVTSSVIIQTEKSNSNFKSIVGNTNTVQSNQNAATGISISVGDFNKNEFLDNQLLLTDNTPQILKKQFKQPQQQQSQAASNATADLEYRILNDHSEMPDIMSGINDVTHIAGINLQDENSVAMNMGGNARIELPSVKEIPLLDLDVLKERFRAKLLQQGLAKPDDEVAELISIACAEDLKNLIEKICINAEHRADNLRADPRYVITKNVRGQLQFLKEVEEAQERNSLDFEKLDQGKIRFEQVYKAELQEQYRRDTENTAMQAILGPKKPRLEALQSDGFDINADRRVPLAVPPLVPFATKRIKYVTKQDMLFVLGQEPAARFRQLLFELYLK